MVIRKAIHNDIQVIVDFQLKMAFETEGISLDKVLLEKGVGKVIEDPSKGFYILALDNDNVMASMLLTPEWSDWRNSLFLWIQSLYVLPEYRKRGVFRKMYDHLKELISRSDKYAGLKLYVDRDNKLAQNVYHQVGMRESHYQLFEWNKLDY